MPYNFVPNSFHTDVTAEALRAKIERYRRFRTNAVTLIQNFRYNRSPPPVIFARLVRPVNALQVTTLPLTVFTQRNFVADFLQAKSDFLRKSAVLRFSGPL